MQIFLCKPQEVFNPSEYVRIEFDDGNLRTYLNGELTDSRPANIGDSFYVIPSGSKKAPKVNKAELPKSRGARIAWALSFVGDNKFATSEKDFWTKYQELHSENLIYNAVYLLNPGVYALCIADRITEPVKVLGKPKVKPKNPVVAWISDNITSDELDELIERFTLERKVFCPAEFVKLL